MIGDYDDDTHFCLKCHSTIIGLDNYVNHRKTGCSKIIVETSKSPSQILRTDESLGLKADDFFSSLELQSSAKKTALPSTSGKQFGILTRSKVAVIQSSSKDVPAEKSDEPKRKELEEYSESDDDLEDYYYDEDEDEFSDEYAPPRNYTGGKWKPSSPTHFEQWTAPPPTHTGGKWKPKITTKDEFDAPPPTHTKGKWKPKSHEEESLVPPPNYTKGKWKPEAIVKAKPVKVKSEPLKTKPKQEDCKKSKEDAKLKLYTKVKWTEPIKVTALQKSSGTIQYWCSPCNRRLSSKVVYERHLKSELHFKRTSQDREFDDGADLNLSKRSLSKPPEPIFSDIKKETTFESQKKRKRKKVYERCGVCQSKVNKHLLGKHLISHYHCRKGNINSSLAKSMVLENIFGIVLHSPFQCSVCRFYCNTHDDFITHWRSEMHKKSESTLKGFYMCSFCKFQCETSPDMYVHLISNEHKDVVAVINRSVPIIVQKVQPIYCITCKARFSLNIELLNHCRKFNHDTRNVQLNKTKYECGECKQVFVKNVSLQRHQRNVHRRSYFICSVCNLEFDDVEKAKSHRNTNLHRVNLAQLREIDARRKCEYCDQILDNFLEYKEHLRQRHEEYLPRCPHCGKIFNVAQELSVHLRNKACDFKNSTKDSDHKCDKCMFSCDSLSEFLYHQALHEEALIIHASFDGKKSSMQYKCPLCQKYFPKSSLQPHLRQHTNEKPFVCRLCDAAFARKNNWRTHERNHEKKEARAKVKLAIGSRPFLCSTCGANFMKKSILKQHMHVHTGKMFRCEHPGCVHSARKMSELRAHYATHSEAKNYACSQCEYRGKTAKHLRRHQTVHEPDKRYKCAKCPFTSRNSWHLKRHLRLHVGSKPYSCPFCPYTCNTMENIRKHILMTNKHPGKCVYECKLCNTRTAGGGRFQSNFAIEFKAHLVNQHGDMFANVTAALTYITGIYEPQEEDTSMFINVQSDEDSNTSGHIIHHHPVEESIMSLHGSDDPIVAQLDEPSTSSASVAAIIKESTFDETLPLFVISKDEIISGDNQTDTWNLVGRYDVEESGALVPFQSDGETLFQEHFQ